MKRKRPRLDSARFRILFLAVVAIVIPGIILAGFGFNLSIEHRYRTEDVVRRAYRAAADSTIGRILSQIQEEEREILYDLANLSESRVLPFATGRLATRAIAEHYFLLSPAFEVLYPAIRPEYVPQPVESKPGPGGRGAEALLEAGYKLEFGEEDLPAAAKKYQTCANGPFSASPRVEALLALGSCFSRLGLFEQAIHAYGRVSREFEPKDVAVPQRLLAQSEICRALEAAGLRVEAVQDYLDAYEGLLREPSSASGADTWEFFCEKNRSALARLLSSNGLDPKYRERFEGLQRTGQVREGERQFRLDLERWLAQRIEWEGRGKGFEPGRFSHSYKLVDGEPYVFACTRLVGEGADAGMLAGYKMSLDYVKRKILPQVIERKIGTGTLTTILDREGRPVLPLEVSDASAPLEAGRYALLREFPSILEFWQLGILDRGNEELLAVTRNQELLITSLLGLTIAIMMGGLYLTLRAVNRDLELSRLKSDFVSNVSHELKTPLTLIRMFAETLMLGRAKTRDKEQEYYRIITRESERLTQLIDNVLDFSRIESGRKQYQFAIEDVGELVRTTVESYREEMEQHGFQVRVDLDGAELFAKIDPSAIAQALLNLVSNAEKYSGDRKEITVSVETDQDEIRLAVRDRGIGVSQADQARIFEKFFRAEDDFVRSVRGSGLGLAIANHTLEAHGGRIELESEPGQGSTFTLVLPRCTREGIHGDLSPGADEPPPDDSPSEPSADRAAGEPPVDDATAEDARESRIGREPSSQRP